MAVMDSLQSEVRVKLAWNQGKLFFMIAGVVAVAVVLVAIAMVLYNNSGAAQLDLSGPGFSGVQNKVKNERNVASFPADGAFDAKAFEDFQKSYDERAANVKAINGFDAEAVNNDAFNITEPHSGL